LFEPLLYHLRGQGVAVGLQEWLAFQRGLKTGLAGSVKELFWLGRCLLVHSEAHFQQYAVAFSAAMEGAEVDPALLEGLSEYLNNPLAWDAARAEGQHDYQRLLDLMGDFQKTLEAQKERHEGGNRWVGTGGTSPYGAGGRANQGIALGRSPGRRTGIRLPEGMDWGLYRSDRRLELRDYKVALKALRNLEKEGQEQLSIDSSIAKTAANGGEIELVFERERANKVRLVLLLDVGGSMDHHTRTVTQLFTAAKEMNTFKSLDIWHFHNCVYSKLSPEDGYWNSTPTDDVISNLRPSHRVIFVGDAAMAPWELFSQYVASAPSGLDWLNKIQRKAPASVWLNPDPETHWNHPTVSAIGEVFPMLPLTLDGLRQAVRNLRQSAD
jgi:uncharacterized protein with von Willebrand factor type A (vWA) domain